MNDPLYLPVVDEGEVQQLLAQLPVSLDKDRFLSFAMGFPRRYLVNTPRLEIVKHFLLMQGRGNSSVISSISKETGMWKLCVVTDDRDYLFSNVAGALSCHGCHISSAEAFANANAVVLDTFYFTDPEKIFSARAQQQGFQTFLESILNGETSLNEHFQSRLDRVHIDEKDSFEIRFDNDSHPGATRLLIDFPDHFGHLYLMSRSISDLGGQIEMAYVEIKADRVRDEFFLTSQSRKLSPATQDRLKRCLEDMGESWRAASPSALA